MRLLGMQSRSEMVCKHVCWRIANRRRQQRAETDGHLRDLEACSQWRYARRDPFQKEMPTPTRMNCSLRRTDGRPIKRRVIVSDKKLVMVIRGFNTGDWLFAEAEESLTTLESPYPSPFLQQFFKSRDRSRSARADGVTRSSLADSGSPKWGSPKWG